MMGVCVDVNLMIISENAHCGDSLNLFEILYRVVVLFYDVQYCSERGSDDPGEGEE